MTGALGGRTVVVTGSASGIGAATARLVAESGGTVIGLDTRPGPHTREFDVTSAQQWNALAADLSDVHGLVCSAGITWRARLGDVTAADFERVQAVNVLGPILAMQALAPRMTAGASVVHVGSLAGTQGHYPVAYTAAKWALRGVTRTACVDLGRRGIRVNIVHPGFVETAMTAGAAEEFRRASVAETPLGRTGTADEVAEVVVFLLGDGASYVTGAEIAVDGGAGAHGGAKSVSDALLADYQPPQTVSIDTQMRI